MTLIPNYNISRKYLAFWKIEIRADGFLTLCENASGLFADKLETKSRLGN